MTVEYLRDLEEGCYDACEILVKERYPEYTFAITEMIRQAKHYQRIAESLLGQYCGHVTYEQNKVNSDKANSKDDWYTYQGE